MRPAALLVFLLASACSGTATRSPSAAASASAPVPHRAAPVLTAAPAPSASVAPASSVKGITIPPLPDVGCDVHGTRWSGALSMRAGLPFARAFEVQATVTLSEPPIAHVTVETNLRVQALVEKPLVYAAAPTTLRGFIVPAPDRALGWARVEKPETVTVSIPTADLFAEPAEVSMDVPCSALAIDEPEYDVPASLVVKRGQEVSVDGGAELAATPGGAAVAKLLPDATAFAELIESRGAARRVLIEGDGYWAVGWVDKKFIGGALLRGVPYGKGSGRLGEYSSHVPTCVHELPVFAQVGAARAHVGTLRAGAGYRVIAPAPAGVEDGWAAFTLVAGSVFPVEGALFLARIEDLDTCSGPPQ